MMKNSLFLLCKNIERFFICLWGKLSCKYLACRNLVSSFFSMLLVLSFHSFFIQLAYFILLSLVCFLALKVSVNPKTVFSKAKDLDVFFMSVSAVTVSSMSTLDMEVFSNSQLIVLTLFMFMGGEVFNSLLGLEFLKFKYLKNWGQNGSRASDSVFISDSESSGSLNNVSIDQVELSIVISENSKITPTHEDKSFENYFLEYSKYNAIRSLEYVVLSYLLVVHVIGSVLILVYITLVQSAKRVLMVKGLNIVTFSVFSTVSTFANCGFIPTNENMVVFKKNTGLLLILIPQTLIGNTLYPVCLRLVILVLEKVSKRVEFGYMLKNSRDKIGNGHLLSPRGCWYLGGNVFGLILVQFVLFCCMELKNSEIMDGLSTYEKTVGSLFQVVNSRHSGESVFDLSKLSSAILVIFVVMMYLPPYTYFMPRQTDRLEEKISRNNDKKSERKMRKRKIGTDYLQIFSPLSYLIIFIILICITERQKLKDDPLNFNVLNITVEVISAYGNVGFSTGYSCERKMKAGGMGYCKDASYGFAGRWSDKGKTILTLVMIFGRLKKFNLKGGAKFWHLNS